MGINIEGGVFLLGLVRVIPRFTMNTLGDYISCLNPRKDGAILSFGLSALGKHVSLLPEPTPSILR